MFYMEMPAHKVEPEWVIGVDKHILCVEFIVRADMGLIALHCHHLFRPGDKVILVLNYLQVVSCAFGGNASETETIQ